MTVSVAELNGAMQALADALRSPRPYVIGRWRVESCPCPANPQPHYLVVGHGVARPYATRASAIRVARQFHADDQRLGMENIP